MDDESTIGNLPMVIPSRRAPPGSIDGVDNQQTV
jgi:hypothetical protein